MSTLHYNNAPITEAGLDIRVRSSQRNDLDTLEKIRDNSYPELFGKPSRVEVKIEGASAEDLSIREISPINTPLGFAYRTSDHKQAFQARLDGFSHHRFAPYQGWDSFVSEARRLWPIYKSIVDPEQIELIGLNYLNEILIPAGQQFEEFFRVYLQIPTELPQVVNSYAFSCQLSLPGGESFLQISEAYGLPRREGFSTINLNIQVFMPLNKDVSQLPDDELWERFESLRLAKDQAFEACITDKVREDIR